MLIESNTFRPMFKSWSPMSLGSWALADIRLFAFLSFLGALADDQSISRGRPGAKLRPPRRLGQSHLRSSADFSDSMSPVTPESCSAVTNRPIWSDTPLLGMLFVVSAASISAALMILLAQEIRLDHARACGVAAHGCLGGCAGVDRSDRRHGLARAGGACLAECLGFAPVVRRDRSRHGVAAGCSIGAVQGRRRII